MSKFSNTLSQYHKLATKVKWENRDSQDSWTIHKVMQGLGLHAESLEKYFTTNDVDKDVKQQPILLSSCRAETY